jgi:DNA-binding winged helix-turn-helix (wHTH) protein
MNHSFKLTFTEFKLLYNLLKEYPEILTKEEVIERVWGKTSVSEATIYTHVFNLNSKLKQWSHEIVIERLKGIKLVIKKGEL